jgi:hypothetical protein
MVSESFILSHAWPPFGFDGHEMNPNGRYFRSFFALSFHERELSLEAERKRQPPNYSYVGDYFSVFLSIYFGKRFENLGFHQNHGHFYLPNVQPVRAEREKTLKEK